MKLSASVEFGSLLTHKTKKVGPLAAAVLNGAFIQGLEFDDYHSKAPIHSGSIVLPTLLALVEHLAGNQNDNFVPIDGASFLLASTIGYEVGPRIGLGLYGVSALRSGWHSGAIFGPAAAAAASAKLLKLSGSRIEDAIGTACTQAGGLMSAQYESMVKRMQHGFAARNGLFATLMTMNGYTGIKQVLERPYGGYLSNFSHGNGYDPPYKPELVTDKLGEHWEIGDVIVKPYASMAANHVAIDCVRALQDEFPDRFTPSGVNSIQSITVEMGETAFQKGGWEATRPITITGAQMSASYAIAAQLVDREVTVAQFLDSDRLNGDSIWSVVAKIICKHNPDFGLGLGDSWRSRVQIDFETGTVQKQLDAPRGINPPLSNEEILTKWRTATGSCLTSAKRDAIEHEVLHLERSTDLKRLTSLLFGADTASSQWQVSNGQ